MQTDDRLSRTSCRLGQRLAINSVASRAYLWSVECDHLPMLREESPDVHFLYFYIFNVDRHCGASGTLRLLWRSSAGRSIK